MMCARDGFKFINSRLDMPVDDQSEENHKRKKETRTHKKKRERKEIKIIVAFAIE